MNLSHINFKGSFFCIRRQKEEKEITNLPLNGALTASNHGDLASRSASEKLTTVRQVAGGGWPGTIVTPIGARV